VPPKAKLDKELKQPDQFLTFSTRAGQWIVARRKIGIGIAIALVVGVGVGWAVFSVGQRGAEHASVAFARIERIATADLLPESGEAKFEDGLPHFKTDRERLEAAIKEADAFIAAGKGGDSMKEAALVLKARYLMGVGKAQDAIAIYQELGGSLDQRLRFLAREGLAYAFEETKQTDKAIEAFGALAEEAKSSGNFLRDRALYNKARLLEQKGTLKDAEKIYRDILAELPQSALKDEINDRLAVLEGK
jgi:tetratricopeptide (TPR) repeat protein